MADPAKRTRWARRRAAAANGQLPATPPELAELPVLSLHHLPGPDGRGPLHEVTDALLGALRYHATLPFQRLLLSALQPRSGTTTLALHLALELARRGERVTLLEANFAHPVLAGLTGRPTIRPGMAELLAGTAELDHARYRSPRLPALEVVAAGHRAHELAAQHSQALLFPPGAAERFVALLDELTAQQRTVIVDGPCLLDEEGILAAAAVATVLLVETPTPLPPGIDRHVRQRLSSAGAIVAGRVRNPHTNCPPPPLPLLDLRPAPPMAAPAGSGPPSALNGNGRPHGGNARRDSARVRPPIPDGMEKGEDPGDLVQRLRRHLGLP